MVEVKVHGLKEIRARLTALPTEINREKIILRALHDGARVIRDDARARAPIGDAIRYVGRGAGKKRKDGTISGRKVRGGLLRSSIVEHTNRAEHNSVFVRVRSKGWRMVNGKISIVRPGSSPGYWSFLEFGSSKLPARPFMRPAFEASKYAAVGVFMESMRRGLDRVMAGIARRFKQS